MRMLLPVHGEDGGPWRVMIEAEPDTFDYIEARLAIFAQLQADYPDLSCMVFGDAIYMEWLTGFWDTEYETYHDDTYEDEIIVLPDVLVLPERSAMRVSYPGMEVYECEVQLVCQDRYISTRYATNGFTVEDLRQAIDSFQGRAA